MLFAQYALAALGAYCVPVTFCCHVSPVLVSRTVPVAVPPPWILRTGQAGPPPSPVGPFTHRMLSIPPVPSPATPQSSTVPFAKLTYHIAESGARLP